MSAGTRSLPDSSPEIGTRTPLGVEDIDEESVVTADSMHEDSMHEDSMHEDSMHELLGNTSPVSRLERADTAVSAVSGGTGVSESSARSENIVVGGGGGKVEEKIERWREQEKEKQTRSSSCSNVGLAFAVEHWFGDNL